VLEVKLDKLELDGKQVIGSVRLSKGAYVRLMISDTGHGMDQRTMERIFEPFFTKKEVGSGSGLGLSVVHGIVSNYNGAIEVESEPEKGSRFMIYLPQHSEEEISGVTATPRKIKKGNGSILFVDDEEEITFMGKRMLESLGYTVEIRTDGLTALEEFKNDPNKYDLLVTDQAMPKMPGTELIGKIKQIRPDLKTIIITGYYDSVPRSDIERFQIEDIISKPIILSEFSELIRKVLSNKHMKKAS